MIFNLTAAKVAIIFGIYLLKLKKIYSFKTIVFNGKAPKFIRF